MDEGLRRLVFIVGGLAAAVLALILVAGLFMVVMMGSMMGGIMGNAGLQSTGAAGRMLTAGGFIVLLIVGALFTMGWAVRQPKRP